MFLIATPILQNISKTFYSPESNNTYNMCLQHPWLLWRPVKVDVQFTYRLVRQPYPKWHPFKVRQHR